MSRRGTSGRAGRCAAIVVALSVILPCTIATAQSPTPQPPAAPQQPAAPPASPAPAPAPAPAQPAAPQTPGAQPPAPATGQPTPAPPAGQQGTTFKSGVEVVSLNVTVTDGKTFLKDLTRDNFAVFEDGVKQEITYFTRTQTPIALSLLIDTSASMDTKLATAQEAAIGFVKRLRPEDIAQIVDFDSRVSILQNFTSDQVQLSAAILKTTPNGSTSLYNAVYIALKELKKAEFKTTDDLHRQAIVVLSDGEDTSSLVPFEEVLELAKRSDVALYCIGLRGKDAAGRGFNEADFVLKQFAQETGGRTFFPQSVSELAAIYAQINAELESQYLMAYTSRNPKRDGQWRRIIVRTDRPNAAPRTKQGYYAPTQ